MSDIPIEQQGRPAEPHFAQGVTAILQEPPHTVGYSINYNNDNRPVLPAVSLSLGTTGLAQHELRAATDAVRQKFFKSIKAHVATANPPPSIKLDPADAQRMAAFTEARKQQIFGQDDGPQPANATPNDQTVAPHGAGIEHFTSPGPILNQHEELLTQNKFESVRVLQAEHSKQFKQEFRQYHENLRDAELRREGVADSANDKLRTNNLNSVLPTNASSGPSTADQPANTDANFWVTDPHEMDRLNKPRITQQLINSADRDRLLYPSPNDYAIELSRTYTNVKRVKLISSEIPNTATLIRDDPEELTQQQRQYVSSAGQILNDANKHIYWINAEDGTRPGMYDCVVYDACITPGNYVSVVCECQDTTLSSEMENQVATINRFIDNMPHQFQITINSQTNAVTVLSLLSQTLPVNPITTNIGTNILTIHQIGNGFQLCDRITITGATAVGGIPASVINDSHEIVEIPLISGKPDPDRYKIRVTTLANQTTVGGGANVQVGIGKPFMLLASNIDTPFSSILGFPQQDSASYIANPIQFINASPPNLMTTDPSFVCTPLTQTCSSTGCCTSSVGCTPGLLPAWICSPNHGLAVGDQILINDTSTIPPINGLRTVTSIINPNTFEVGLPVKVVNNQVTTTDFVLGCLVRSLDQQVSQITKLTTAQTGSICTLFPHDLSTLAPGNTVWVGNVITGSVPGSDEYSINGIQTVSSVITGNCFTIEGGIQFAGVINDNAYIVKTTSTHLIPINYIEPANNGRFCPDSSVPVYTGINKPDYVLFQNTDTVPDINGVIAIDQDLISTCSNTVIKNQSDTIWQSFTPSVTNKLVGIYIRVGEGIVSDIASLSIYQGFGPADPNKTFLATGDHGFVNRDVCIGTQFCVPSIVVTAGTQYFWLMNLVSRPNQQVVLCYGTTTSSPPLIYIGGHCDIGPLANYEFRTFMSSGVQNITYYSESTGKFTLDTVISHVNMQNPNQSYIRSIDGNIRCIQDAFVASNGVWTFDSSHGLSVGDSIFVNAIGGTVSDTSPTITPNVIGIITVDNVIDSSRISTTTRITTSTYTETGSSFILEAVRTFATTASTIVNVYPQSTGYLCKQTVICDTTRPQCVICPGDKVIVRGGVGNTLASFNTDLIEYDAVGNILGNIYGCYTLVHAYNNVSSVCDTIFDLSVPGRIELPSGGSNLGEIARLDTSGGVDGRDGTFAVARVFFKSEICTIGVNSVAKSNVTFTALPEIIYANALFTLGASNKPASVLSVDPFQPTAPLSGVLRVFWPNHGRAAAPLVNAYFCISRADPAPSGEINPPITIQQIGVGGWSVFDSNHLQFNGYAGLGATNFGGSNVIATPVNPTATNPNPTMFWKINTPTINYYVWYQMAFPSGPVRGTKPSGAVVTGRTGIPSGTTGILIGVFDTLDDIATKTQAAINAAMPAAIVYPPIISGDTITIQNTALGTSNPHILDGAPSPTNISINTFQFGGIATTQATEFVNSLSVQSFQPHLLSAGDAVYIIDPMQAPNCPTTTSSFGLPLPSQNIHNSVGFVVPDVTDASVFNIFGLSIVSGISTFATLCQTSLNAGITPIIDRQIYYHKICGSTFSPIINFYPKSYNGMLESPKHGFTGNTDIYVSNTITTPVINGCQTACVIDDNFFALTGNTVITTGSVNGPNVSSGQYVQTSNTSECGGQCFPLRIFSIGSANTGVIVAPNDFQGNECVYFLNDTNINNGSSNDLRNKFFTVTAIDSTQFALNVPIDTIGSVLGDGTTACQTIIFNNPAENPYCFIAQSSEYYVNMSGAGGGNGLDYTTYPPNSVVTGTPGKGGRGGLVTGVIKVTVGQPVYVYVGGAGENGKFNQDSAGGINGGGTSQSSNTATGNGGGGGASDIRLGGTSLTNRIVVAGGGGGGTGFFKPIHPMFSDPTTAQAELQVGYNGGDGGGSFASPNGADGGGNIGPTYNAAGRGGTQIAGGAGGTETALFMLNSANPGSLGQGGGNNIPFGPIPRGHQSGGGGGYYGGGAGFVFSGDVSYIGEGAGGGGSAYFSPTYTTNCDGITGGGVQPNTNGYVILTPLNIATFDIPGTTTFQVPTNAINLTVKVYGGYGGKGGNGPINSGAPGARGGAITCKFYIGAASQIQPGTIFTLTVGGQGANGPNYNDPVGSQAIGGYGGGGNGPAKAFALSTTGVGGGGGGASYITLPTGAMLILAAGGGGGAGGDVTGGNTPGIGSGYGNGQDAALQISSGATLTTGGTANGGYLIGGSATGNELNSGGGGGGGYYGGGAGNIVFDSVGNYAFGSYAGGGGSGFITSDGETQNSSTVSYTTDNPLIIPVNLPLLGYGAIIITWEVQSPPLLPMGHFIQVPCLASCDPCSGQTNKLSLIEEQTNGVFTSAEDTGFPICSITANATCIFITDGKYELDVDNATISDKLALACPFQTPSPLYSTTKFETNLYLSPFAIDPISALGGNNVDDVSTSDLRYPDLNGLGWILATDCLVNPIVSIVNDSNGTLSPVAAGLAVGDSIYIDSIHPTTQDLNGVHVISYIDVGNATPQFFELKDIKLIDIDGPVANGNIWYFKTSPVTGNLTAEQECLTITNISSSCPTKITAAHNFTIGTRVSIYVQNTLTTPSINSTETIPINGTPEYSYIGRDIINDVIVVDSNTLQLPLTDTSGNTLCNIEKLNQTYTLTQPRGTFSKQFLSTNCGCSVLEADPLNNRTIVHSPTRPNVESFIAYAIVSNVPHLNGSSTITVNTTNLNQVWKNGTKITISGQILGVPYIGVSSVNPKGQYKIYNVTSNSFDILSGAGVFSTGGTGGYANGPAPQTVPGHGLQTGDLVKFGKTTIADQSNNVDEKIYSVTVINPDDFTINFLIPQPEALGSWCSNWVNAEIPNHGLVDGDIFFLYGAGCVGGLLMTDLNTSHGEKRHNIPTQIEIETRKIVRVVDDNNFQFQTNRQAFPTVRTLGGGYQVCISSRNHLYCETPEGITGNIACEQPDGCTGNIYTGPIRKNYGFNDIQSNLNCLGQNVQQFLNFSIDPYILLTSNRLTMDDSNPVLNTGAVNNIYSKVQLSSTPGDVAYNTYIGGERIFYEPIAKLNRVDFQWFRPDGKLFDFRGREHSFTIEIEEYQDRLRTANKSSRRGLNDPGAVGQLGLVESTISRENPTQNLGGQFNPSQFAAAAGSKNFLQSN